MCALSRRTTAQNVARQSPRAVSELIIRPRSAAGPAWFRDVSGSPNLITTNPPQSLLVATSEQFVKLNAREIRFAIRRREICSERELRSVPKSADCRLFDRRVLRFG